MDDLWGPIKSRYENSVIQIQVISGEYNPMRPYSGPSDGNTSGSGFIIDAERGIVVTNAHVVDNPISITGKINKLGRKDIRMYLRCISPEKDLAILTIDKRDLPDVLAGEDPKLLSMDLGDNMKISQTDSILVIGYPLGERGVKYSTGIISGFHADNETGFYTSKTEDSYSRFPSYIQITAPLNPGVSGGPLVNKEGSVIGINSAGRNHAQNIGYAIGIRSLLSLYKEMIRNPLINLPTFNLRWNVINEDASESLCGEKIDGIYVRKTLPDSILNKLQKGDIISHMSYKDPFWDKKKINLKSYEKEANDHGKNINIYINNSGDLMLCMGELDIKNGERVNSCESMVKRKVAFSELVDMIPYGNTLNVTYNRAGKWNTLKTKFEHVESKRKKNIIPLYQDFEYRIVGGLCITPLLLNQLDKLERFKNIQETDYYDDFIYNDHLFISQVFPNTQAFIMGNISAGDIITKINDKEVKTLADLDEQMKSKTKFIKFEVEDGSQLILDKKKLKNEDKLSNDYLNL